MLKLQIYKILKLVLVEFNFKCNVKSLFLIPRLLSMAV
ncbi:hypothetical protein PEC301879_14620 [Pectobacterium carotovorum subsp. carotovorum]|nr:hypothetical protein PEC301879_14620 [Pectobacterium carotovorum subsp. carotovorum]